MVPIDNRPENVQLTWIGLFEKHSNKYIKNQLQNSFFCNFDPVKDWFVYMSRFHTSQFLLIFAYCFLNFVDFTE